MVLTIPQFRNYLYKEAFIFIHKIFFTAYNVVNDIGIFTNGGGMMRWCAKNRGALILSFGAGVIISSFCPANILLILLAIALVLLGIAYLKS